MVGSRRAFLACSSGLALGAALPTGALAAATSQPYGLNLVNTHTHEHLKINFREGTQWIDEALSELDLFLRDHREFKCCEMDRQLYDVLWQVQQSFGHEIEIQIISGYRTRKTNNMLRGLSANVASNSYHIQGRAIDFRVSGHATADLAERVRKVHSGGVGYYPSDRFVHIDTGPLRSWRS